MALKKICKEAVHTTHMELGLHLLANKKVMSDREESLPLHKHQDSKTDYGGKI